MKTNSRMFAVTLLASAFATAAWAQELGQVHFQTSCTPQAQQKFDRASQWCTRLFIPTALPRSPRPLRPIPNAQSPTGVSR